MMLQMDINHWFAMVTILSMVSDFNENLYLGVLIRNIIMYLEAKFRPNRRIFVFWQPFWIQDGHHGKPTMDINSQHHNLIVFGIGSH
jgi:hypothetical protein